MKRILLILALLTSFSAVAGGYAEEDIAACPQAFSTASDGSVAVKPYNSTLCPQDKLVRLTYRMLPAATSLAGGLFSIDNHEAIIEAAKEEEQATTSTVNLSAVESSAVSLVDFMLPLTVLGFIYWIFANLFVVQTGGKNRLLLYTMTSSTVALFVLPFDFGHGRTNLTAVTAASAIFGGVGMFNVANSTLINLTEKSRMASDLANDVAPVEPKRAYSQAREAIETAMCVDSSALMGVFSAAEDGVAANYSLEENASALGVSIVGDGTSSQYQYDPETKSLISGWALSDPEGRKVCASKDLTEPTADIDDSHIALINKAVANIDLLTIDRKKAEQEWDEYSQILDMKDEEKKAFAHYFFSRLLWRLSGGDVGESENTMALVNKQLTLAHAVSREVRSMACYGDRITYAHTANAIKHLNRGDVGAPEFMLDCSIARNGKMEMLFEASTDDAQAFASRGLELMNSHPLRLKNEHSALIDSFVAEGEVKFAASNVLGKLSFSKATEEAKAKQFSDLGVQMRLDGFFEYGVNMVGLIEDYMAVAVAMADSGTLSASSPVTTTTHYSGERAYVPDSMENKGIIDKIVMPSFLYYEELGGDDLSRKIQSNLQAQINTGQGGTSGFMIGSTGGDYHAVGLKSSLTQAQLIDTAGEDIITSLTSTVSPVTSSNPKMTDGQMRLKVTEFCTNDITPSKAQVEKLGITSSEFIAMCNKQKTLAIAHYRNQSLMVLDKSFDLAAIGAAALAANKLMGIKNKSQHDGGIANKKVNTDPTADFVRKSLDSVGAPKFAADKAASAVSGMVNSSVTQYMAKTVLGLALMFGVLSMLVYLLPSLIFTFSAISFVSIAIVYAIFGSLTLMMLVVVGGNVDVIRKSLLSGLINMLFRPMFLALALVISIVAVQAITHMMDLMIVEMGSAGSELSGISLVVYNLLKTITVIAFLLFAMREAVTYANEAIDRLIQSLGASEIGHDEGSAALAVAGAAATNEAAKSTVEAGVNKINGR